jgi:hypothetical protein
MSLDNEEDVKDATKTTKHPYLMSGLFPVNEIHIIVAEVGQGRLHGSFK